jgi:hypothetical protein
MFWNGKITDFQIASINSFMKNNFKVYFWSYQDYDLPRGVIKKNANEILSQQLLESFPCIPRMYLKENAFDEAIYTAQSDIIRFIILQHYDGWWSDCDVFCMKNADMFDELFSSRKNICAGFVDDSLVNSAVIAFPNKDIAKFIDEENQRVLDRADYLEFGELNLGPLNKVIKDKNLVNEILPYKYFYPHTGDTTDFWSGNRDSLLIPEVSESYTIHWENSFDHKAANSGSFKDGYMMSILKSYLT